MSMELKGKMRGWVSENVMFSCQEKLFKGERSYRAGLLQWPWPRMYVRLHKVRPSFTTPEFIMPTKSDQTGPIDITFVLYQKRKCQKSILSRSTTNFRKSQTEPIF